MQMKFTLKKWNVSEIPIKKNLIMMCLLYDTIDFSSLRILTALQWNWKDRFWQAGERSTLWSSGLHRSRFCVLRSFFFNVKRTMVWALPTLVMWMLIKKTREWDEPVLYHALSILLSREIRLQLKDFEILH